MLYFIFFTWWKFSVSFIKMFGFFCTYSALQDKLWKKKITHSLLYCNLSKLEMYTKRLSKVIIIPKRESVENSELFLVTVHLNSRLALFPLIFCQNSLRVINKLRHKKLLIMLYGGRNNLLPDDPPISQDYYYVLVLRRWLKTGHHLFLWGQGKHKPNLTLSLLLLFRFYVLFVYVKKEEGSRLPLPLSSNPDHHYHRLTTHKGIMLVIYICIYFILSVCRDGG